MTTVLHGIDRIQRKHIPILDHLLHFLGLERVSTIAVTVRGEDGTLVHREVGSKLSVLCVNVRLRSDTTVVITFWPAVNRE